MSSSKEYMTDKDYTTDQEYTTDKKEYTTEKEYTTTSDKNKEYLSTDNTTVPQVLNISDDYYATIVYKRFVDNVYVRFVDLTRCDGFKYNTNWAASLTIDQFEKLINCHNIVIECTDIQICVLSLPGVCHVYFSLVLPNSLELYKMVVKLQKQLDQLDRKMNTDINNIRSEVLRVKHS
jgi:hypothetical protein